MSWLAKRFISAAILLAIVAGPASARDLPDLVIISADLRHSGDCSGQQPLIVGPVKIKNVGQGRGQIFTTKVMLQTRANGQPTIAGNDRFVNSMRPDEVVTVEARIKAAAPVAINGRVELELTVDPVDVFAEENDANNSARVVVDVRCPKQ